MKLKILLIILLLGGCSNSISSSNNRFIKESIVSNYSSSEIKDNDSSSLNTSNVSSCTNTTTITINNSSSGSNTSNSSLSSSSSNYSSNVFNICEEKPGGKNEDGSDKLPITCNKQNKIKIGNDNKSMTSFSFVDSLPDYFRAIYGNNFNSSKNLYYSSNNGGGLKIDMGGPSEPAKGIQTAMFESNLKLEIRVNIGAMFNNSKGNKVDKDLPVMVIYAFDENGKYLRKAKIEEITKNNENGTIKRYIDGSDVAYLEIRALQCAYKSSQGYNFALLGLDLIAWPYPLD